MERRPAVAGRFYSGSPGGLSEEVKQYIPAGAERIKATGIVSPHAGLMYSGAVAGAVYSRIEFPGTFILIGPNHTGLGKPLSIMKRGRWGMPTGSLTIDEVLAGRISGLSGEMEEDNSAHSMEHSLEVQLPFILHFSSSVKIVPIVIMRESLDSCRLLGESIAEAVKDAGYPVTIVASSDMSHYVTDYTARVKDKKAIDKILSLDPAGLYNTVMNEDISMCGFIPATVMLYAAKKLGAKEALLVKYMTSGEVSGDYDHVVGYAGVIIKQG